MCKILRWKEFRNKYYQSAEQILFLPFWSRSVARKPSKSEDLKKLSSRCLTAILPKTLPLRQRGPSSTTSSATSSVPTLRGSCRRWQTRLVSPSPHSRLPSASSSSALADTCSTSTCLASYCLWPSSSSCWPSLVSSPRWDPSLCLIYKWLKVMLFSFLRRWRRREEWSESQYQDSGRSWLCSPSSICMFDEIGGIKENLCGTRNFNSLISDGRTYRGL